MNTQGIQNLPTPTNVVEHVVVLLFGASAGVIFMLYISVKGWVSEIQKMPARTRWVRDIFSSSVESPKKMRLGGRADEALLSLLLACVIGSWVFVVIMSGYLVWRPIVMHATTENATLAIYLTHGYNPLSWIHWTPVAKWWLIGSIPIFILTLFYAREDGCLTVGGAFLLWTPTLAWLLAFTFAFIGDVFNGNWARAGNAGFFILMSATVAASTFAALRSTRELGEIWLGP